MVYNFELARTHLNWWQLFLFIAFVWYLAVAAIRAQLALKDATDPLPTGRRGDSLHAAATSAPIVMFWGAAMLVDTVADPWGTTVVVSIHVILAGLAITCIVARPLAIKANPEGA